MSSSHIYALVDSREPDELRYIGVTSVKLATRLRQHIGSSQEKHHRAHWIRKVLREGGSVNIRSLMTCNTEAAGRLETDVIGFYRRAGCRLTNSTIGGDGGRSPVADVRRRLSENTNGPTLTRQRFSNPEVRATHGDRIRAGIAAMTQEARERKRERLKAYLKSPEVKDQRRSIMQKAYADPDVRRRVSERTKAALSDPDVRRRISDGIRAAWAQRRKATIKEQ